MLARLLLYNKHEGISRKANIKGDDEKMSMENKQSAIKKLEDFIYEFECKAVDLQDWDNNSALAFTLTRIVFELNRALNSIEQDSFELFKGYIAKAVCYTLEAQETIIMGGDSDFAISFNLNASLPMIEYKTETFKAIADGSLDPNSLDFWVDKDVQSALNKEYQDDTYTDA